MAQEKDHRAKSPILFSELNRLRLSNTLLVIALFCLCYSQYTENNSNDDFYERRRPTHPSENPYSKIIVNTERVAHCLIGEPRTLNYPEVFRMYKTQAIEPLETESDLFFLLDNRKKDNICSQCSRWYPSSRYSRALQYLDAKNVLWIDDEILSNNRDGVPVEYTTWEHFFKYELCYQMIQKEEATRNITYSHVIFTKPNVILPIPLSRSSELTSDTIMSASSKVAVEHFSKRNPSSVLMSTEIKRRRCLSEERPEEYSSPLDNVTRKEGSQWQKKQQRTQEMFNIVPRPLLPELIDAIKTPTVFSNNTHTQFYSFLKDKKMTISYHCFWCKFYWNIRHNCKKMPYHFLKHCK